MPRHIVLVKRSRSQQFCLDSMAKSGTYASSSSLKLGHFRKKNLEERQTWVMVLLVWSKISNALKRLGFRSRNFLAQLLPETSRTCTIRVRRSSSGRLWNDLGSHACLHHRNQPYDFLDYRTWSACAPATTYDSLLSSIPRTIVQLNPSFSDSLKEPHAVLATQSRPQHGLL